MTKKLKTIPRFETEVQERAFWAKHDTTDYFDLSLAESATFQNLKPSARTISTRLPAWLLEALKVLANKRDVPFGSNMSAAEMWNVSSSTMRARGSPCHLLLRRILRSSPSRSSFPTVVRAPIG